MKHEYKSETIDHYHTCDVCNKDVGLNHYKCEVCGKDLCSRCADYHEDIFRLNPPFTKMLGLCGNCRKKLIPIARKVRPTVRKIEQLRRSPEILELEQKIESLREEWIKSCGV